MKTLANPFFDPIHDCKRASFDSITVLYCVSFSSSMRGKNKLFLSLSLGTKINLFANFSFSPVKHYSGFKFSLSQTRCRKQTGCAWLLLVVVDLRWHRLSKSYTNGLVIRAKFSFNAEYHFDRQLSFLRFQYIERNIGEKWREGKIFFDFVIIVDATTTSFVINPPFLI